MTSAAYNWRSACPLPPHIRIIHCQRETGKRIRVYGHHRRRAMKDDQLSHGAASAAQDFGRGYGPRRILTTSKLKAQR